MAALAASNSTQVGTQFLAYDLDRLRKAVGADKLNVYGALVGLWQGFRLGRCGCDSNVRSIYALY